jgi:malate/lactate dehydrogenase
MSVANQKGGYFRTIEINRDTVANSVTTLLEPILKQAGNYIAQVQRFVTNITPQINTFTTPLISILAKPDPTNVGTIDDLDNARAAYNIALAPPVYFSPTNVHSVTELARTVGVLRKAWWFTIYIEPGLYVSDNHEQGVW